MTQMQPCIVCWSQLHRKQHAVQGLRPLRASISMRLPSPKPHQFQCTCPPPSHTKPCTNLCIMNMPDMTPLPPPKKPVRVIPPASFLSKPTSGG